MNDLIVRLKERGDALSIEAATALECAVDTLSWERAFRKADRQQKRIVQGVAVIATVIIAVIYLGRP